MGKRKRSGRSLAAAAALVLCGAAPSWAGSVNVSSTGLDSGSCGPSDDPCATIAQAVTNAAPGDTIAVGPGVFAGASIVDKAVTLVSSAGSGAAIINSTMNLNFQGIVLGRKGKGFSFNVAGTAVSVNGDEIAVRGNRFSDGTVGVEVNVSTDVVVRENSFDNVATGISNVSGETTVIRGNSFGYVSSAAVVLGSLATGATVRENRTYGPSGTAFLIDGTGHVFFRNQVHGTPGGGFVSSGAPSGVVLQENVVVSSSSPAYYLQHGSGWILTRNAALHTNAPGFYLTAGTPVVLTGNVSVGNGGTGILVAGGSDHVLTGNTVIQNASDGIVFSGVGAGVTVEGGNVYGNATNCGIVNSSASTINTSDVYWGHPTGPGADPADDVCGNIPAIVVDSPADAPAKVKMPSIK